MSVAQANARAATALVGALAERAAHAVISPGSRNTPLALALDAAPTMTTHVVLDERTAGFFALGLARSTGTPVILSCTSGSAGAHYLPALIEAFEGMTPLIAITADRPPELHGFAAPQTTQQSELFGRHVLSRYELPLPDETDDAQFYTLGSQALSAACDGPGPIHLNAPFREPLWDEGVSYAAQPLTSPATPRPLQEDTDARSTLTDALAGTKRGLIVVGARSRQDQLAAEPAFSRACHQLANKIGWPILTDITSGARFASSESSVHITGFDTLLRFERFASELPDRVLILGRPPTSKVLNLWLTQNEVPAVILSHRPDHRDPMLCVETEIAANPRAVLPSLDTSPNIEWQEHWSRGEHAYRAVLEGLDDWWEGPLARMVAHSVPDGGLLHLSSSMPIRDADGFSGPLRRPLTVTSNRGVNGIDGIIATAAGQAIGWQSPVTLLIGDLAFLHDLGSLRDAVSREVALTLVVVNNGGGHIFDFLPIANHPDAFERYFLTPQHPNIRSLAEGTGARHTLVSDLDALRAALLASHERPGVDVIEARVDGGENRPRHEAFYRRVHEELR